MRVSGNGRSGLGGLSEGVDFRFLPAVGMTVWAGRNRWGTVYFQGNDRAGGLGVVDGGWGLEAEATVFVEVEAVAEELQVSHAAGGLDDLFFGSG